jgi:hypothetical protein
MLKKYHQKQGGEKKRKKRQEKFGDIKKVNTFAPPNRKAREQTTENIVL